MGQIFQVVEGKPAVGPTERPGCWVEVLGDPKKAIRRLCKLELDPASPLTPRTQQMERLPDPKGQATARFEIGDGVWWCNDSRYVEHFLVVREDELRIASKAQAYCELGAVQALQQLDLGDAAVALAAGEFDLASVQVIAERERRARGG
ncbi:MAG: hypothetical protein H6Q89_1753 [Myxococcaceae bacterium]|nr:hypothetical protein [Myxococcaceae bacterium]